MLDDSLASVLPGHFSQAGWLQASPLALVRRPEVPEPQGLSWEEQSVLQVSSVRPAALRPQEDPRQAARRISDTAA